MKKVIFSTITLLFAIYAWAQNKPNFNPIYFLDTTTGKLYWNKHLPVYIFLSPKPSTDSAILLKSHVSAQYDNPFYFDTEGINYIRTKWAVDKKTMKPVPNVEILWEVYADGIPPFTKIHLIDPNKYFRNDTIFCSKQLRITFTSYDKTSGVKNIYLSINQKPYQIYTDTITLNTQGNYTIQFFAVDRVNNVEKTRKISFIEDFDPPVTKSIITGVYIGKKNIVSVNTNIFLESSDNISGVKHTYYRLDSTKWNLYTPKTRIPLAYLNDGEHTLQFYSIDFVNNKEPIQTYKFYLDKTAPITIADVLGDKFIVNGKVYFSGRTKMKLTSVDKKSGVKSVYYSIDGGKFKKYTDPFYLPNVPGWHTVRYFAVDSTENVTVDNLTQSYYEYRMKVDKIYMDLVGPTLHYYLSGPLYKRSDTAFISPKTKIILSASDPESGVKYIAYTIDNNKHEQIYTKPFTLSNLPPGLHKITVVGYDNVNNRNYKTFEVYLDKKPPKIIYNFDISPIAMEDSLPVYLTRTKLFLSFVDDITGTSQIYYSLNNSPLSPYKNYITGFKKGLNTIKIVVYDKVGNKATKIIKFYVK